MTNTLPLSATLLQVAFVMLAAGACGGLLFALLRALRVRYPAWFGAAHGLLGLAALAVLGLALVKAPVDVPMTRAWWALGVFAATLLGGLTFFRWLSREKRPPLLAAMHGSLALLGLYLLYPVAFGASAL